MWDFLCVSFIPECRTAGHSRGTFCCCAEGRVFGVEEEEEGIRGHLDFRLVIHIRSTQTSPQADHQILDGTAFALESLNKTHPESSGCWSIVNKSNPIEIDVINIPPTHNPERVHDPRPVVTPNPTQPPG